VVSHRIGRGNTTLEAADFLEIGVAGDGRIAAILAVNHAGEDELLRELVRRRVKVGEREGMLRDPGVALAELLNT
jgi:hypothetical protein